MATNQARKEEALEWAEGVIADPDSTDNHAARWGLVGRFRSVARRRNPENPPAVIVSNDASNRNLNRVQVVPITSNVTHVYPCEASIDLSDQPHKAMADQIATAEETTSATATANSMAESYMVTASLSGVSG